jgi:dienelactone hydrolase
MNHKEHKGHEECQAGSARRRRVGFVPFVFFVVASWTVPVHADGPADNLVGRVRPIPPPGIVVPAPERAELEAGVAALGREIDTLRQDLRSRPALLALLPDVQIYYSAVRYPLTYHEFQNPREFAVARALLKQAHERADELRNGRAPWNTATGLVVRGYVSKIDGSVQPYGLVVPASYQPNTPHRYRLDTWFHGRAEYLTELNFLHDRETRPGDFTPPHTFVLHPYGRYCNANKFAGEVDLFEALADVKKHYPIDENRIVVRGFSMGGAACWQFAVHHAGLWAAAAPGAGFTETADFLKVFQHENLKPTWYEQKLWHLYDCTDYAVNLFNCPTVAYSGEIDNQKQAADQMEKALREEGMTLAHIIGPKTGHAYHPVAKAEIARRIDAIAEHGRNPIPRRVRFSTWTLRYNKMLWVQIDGLSEHWERARANAEILDDRTVRVWTQNVTDLTLMMGPGRCPLDDTHRPKLSIHTQELVAPPVLSDRSWTVHLHKTDKEWECVQALEPGLHKRHGLQGPIDDAFFDRFLMVRPTGKARHEKVATWTAAEMAHAIEHWRRQFRGEAPVKDDTAVTAADIADSNLILWGDPGSNHILARIADRLPIRWDGESVHAAHETYPSMHHVPVLIYPNPLNPKRYVVLNSGFTYREYDYLNNARQVPKLPDYAVIDVDRPRTSRTPGGVVEAGFFDERWQLKEHGQ